MFLRKELKEKYAESMEKYGYLKGAELDAAIRKEGISMREVKKHYSIRGIRGIKRGFATAFTSPWSPVAWPTYWLPKGLGKLLGVGGQKAKEYAIEKGSYLKARIQVGKVKWKEETQGAITDVALAGPGAVGWALKTVITAPRNILGWFVPSIKQPPPLAKATV